MSGEHAKWKFALVRELGDVQLGRQRSPSAAVGPNQTPYLRVANVFDGFVDYSDVLKMSFSQAERRVFGVQPGDILLNEGQSLELVGRSAIYEGPPDRYCIQNTLVRFRCGENLVPAFAQATFKRWMDTGRFAQIAKQTTSIAHLGAGRFGALVMSLPPVPEQRRIAEVLGAIDEAIRGTEQVIAKLRQMKQGLLHDLLTRGIDENGELRDPDRHPENFKDSPLGRIPREWDACSLSQVVPVAEYGISVPLAEHGAIPVLRMMNFVDGEVDLAELKFSDGPEARSLLLKPGDVLFNRTNSIDHVGRTGIWRGQLPSVSFASYLVRLVPAPDRLLAEFLNRWLNWEATQTRVRRWATPGVSQVNINPTNLRRTLIALPRTLAEQERISSALLQHDVHAEAARSELDKIRTLKHGLMDDLLTGKVRVISEESAR